MAYSGTIWDSTTANNISIVNNTIQNNATASWENYIRSTNTALAADLPSVKFTHSGSASSVKAAFGIGIDPLHDNTSGTSDFDYIDYRYRINNSSYTIEIGNGSTSVKFTGTHVQNNVYEIVLTSTQMHFKVNSSIKYSHTLPPSTDVLYQHAVLKDTSNICTGEYENFGSSSSGGGGSGGSSTISEGTFIDHILYMQTVVPK